jgi:cytochrome c oxidase subunit 2
MVPEELLEFGQFRLLEARPIITLPVNTVIRVVVSSNDVLHSWAIPSFGIKVDACPGRLNSVFLNIMREGLYYGQCSELCGSNHAFMPITIYATKCAFLQTEFTPAFMSHKVERMGGILFLIGYSIKNI